MTLEAQILNLIANGHCRRAQLFAALPKWTRSDIHYVLSRLLWRGYIEYRVGNGYRVLWENARSIMEAA